MKAKIMDMDTDWEAIKNTQLAFLLNEKTNIVFGGDHRYVGTSEKPKDAPVEDPRENLLRGLVQVAAFN
jgi:hypothetical protein